ncbi:MAG TPA: AMP-binding protein [Acidimicrobiales bacterium]|nr:AMP-binding protein [Acidimicrobiales bacterium]
MTTLLTDHLRAMADAFPEETAYRVVDGGTVTFGEWEAESNRLARALTAMGVAKGDRVSLYLRAEEALRFMVGYSAVHKAGAVAVPTNTRLADTELELLLGHADVRALLTDTELSPLAHRVAGALGGARHVVVAPMGEETGAPPWSWGEVTQGQDASTTQVALADDDLADILYTSGTTGLPKGVAIRHRNIALIPGAPNPNLSGGCWLHASPLFTFAGIGFVYNPMQLGLTGIYQPRFDAGRWLQVVEEFRPQFVFLVPSMAQLLVAHPRFAEAALDSIQLCAIGSAPLAPATLRAMQERMPEAAVSNSYGMTEAGPAYCTMPKGEALKRIGSVGQPMAPLELRFVDEDGADVGPGGVGEILLRMQGRQREYYNNPEATAATWTEGGWLRTGDLGRLDADGYLYIVGRKKDIIIRGGNNVHAQDVETVLHDMPGVVEAAVVGVPHEVLGEDVAAAVVLAPDARCTPDDIREFCAERLADYKVPRRIAVVDDLPRNATGKVLKAQLRSQLLAATPPGT